MSGNWTPGPWKACTGSGRGHCSCGQVWSTAIDRNVAIATHISQYRDGTDEHFEAVECVIHSEAETNANAGLIASSPDLYEALAEWFALAAEQDQIRDQAFEWLSQHGRHAPNCQVRRRPSDSGRRNRSDFPSAKDCDCGLESLHSALCQAARTSRGKLVDQTRAALAKARGEG